MNFIPDFFELPGDGYIYREGDGELVVMCTEEEFFDYIQNAYDLDDHYQPVYSYFWEEYGHHRFYLEFFHHLNN